jgi:hypothetical protein
MPDRDPFDSFVSSYSIVMTHLPLATVSECALNRGWRKSNGGRFQKRSRVFTSQGIAKARQRGLTTAC